MNSLIGPEVTNQRPGPHTTTFSQLGQQHLIKNKKQNCCWHLVQAWCMRLMCRKWPASPQFCASQSQKTFFFAFVPPLLFRCHMLSIVCGDVFRYQPAVEWLPETPSRKLWWCEALSQNAVRFTEYRTGECVRDDRLTNNSVRWPTHRCRVTTVPPRRQEFFFFF